jgi:hypothetical protein
LPFFSVVAKAARPRRASSLGVACSKSPSALLISPSPSARARPGGHFSPSGGALPVGSLATQSPAHSFVPLTVPTILHPVPQDPGDTWGESCEADEAIRRRARRQCRRVFVALASFGDQRLSFRERGCSPFAITLPSGAAQRFFLLCPFETYPLDQALKAGVRVQRRCP